MAGGTGHCKAPEEIVLPLGLGSSCPSDCEGVCFINNCEGELYYSTRGPYADGKARTLCADKSDDGPCVIKPGCYGNQMGWNFRFAIDGTGDGNTLFEGSYGNPDTGANPDMIWWDISALQGYSHSIEVNSDYKPNSDTLFPVRLTSDKGCGGPPNGGIFPCKKVNPDGSPGTCDSNNPEWPKACTNCDATCCDNGYNGAQSCDPQAIDTSKHWMTVTFCAA